MESGSECKAVKLPRGTYAKVARIHRVSRQFVRMVDIGAKHSATVEATLRKYREKYAGTGEAAA